MAATTPTLYLGNLPDTASDEEISALCSRRGLSATAVRRVRDRATGRPRGFAFVDLEGEADVREAARALADVELLGRRLTIRVVGNESRAGER